MSALILPAFRQNALTEAAQFGNVDAVHLLLTDDRVQVTKTALLESDSYQLTRILWTPFFEYNWSNTYTSSASFQGPTTSATTSLLAWNG